MQSLADFIITMCVFRFSVHTGSDMKLPEPRDACRQAPASDDGNGQLPVFIYSLNFLTNGNDLVEA
jgi:hypothetical protein